MSAHLGEDYKPLKPSDTIKELSDMCFGHDYADVVSPTVLAQKDGNGVYHIVSHDVTDHAAELAEALTYLLVCTNRESVPFECITMAQKALYEYKQSRGE